ncbi:hypothetical protein KY285_032670 [Solanum tuberosum]|nr:hypothetical protein KY289_032780 [Solanum tuberosum]KAH0647422.1 hypothetical protein KY285_032670 [Solanum tuberosum]
MVELNGDGKGSDNGSNLLENFEFDYEIGFKWVMQSLRERWRALKYKLRCNNFYPNKSKEELLAKPPENVDSIDWIAFVHHCNKDKMKEQKLKRLMCRSEVILSTLLKKDGNYVNEILADKISEHLPKDQELAASSGVPMKILAHPNDAVGKVYGVEHSDRVRGLGGNVCPSNAFGMPRIQLVM